MSLTKAKAEYKKLHKVYLANALGLISDAIAGREITPELAAVMNRMKELETEFPVLKAL